MLVLDWEWLNFWFNNRLWLRTCAIYLTLASASGYIIEIRDF